MKNTERDYLTPTNWYQCNVIYYKTNLLKKEKASKEAFQIEASSLTEAYQKAREYLNVFLCTPFEITSITKCIF